MSDIERIHALRDAGHITPEEAERLIGVLNELDEVPGGGSTEPVADAAAADAPPPTESFRPPEAPGAGDVRDVRDVGDVADVGAAVAASVRAAAREAAASVREAVGAARRVSSQASDTAGQARAAGSAGDTTPIELAPAGTRWCAIELTAADLSVVADDIAEPVVKGDDEQRLTVTPTDDGIRVTSERG